MTWYYVNPMVLNCIILNLNTPNCNQLHCVFGVSQGEWLMATLSKTQISLLQLCTRWNMIRQHMSCRNCYWNTEMKNQLYSGKRTGEESRREECVFWTLKNWLDFSWWGMWIINLRWGGQVPRGQQAVWFGRSRVPGRRTMGNQAPALERSFNLISFDQVTGSFIRVTFYVIRVLKIFFFPL